KKITPAPRKTPLQPNVPNAPVLGGMNGCQFALLIYIAPNPTNSSSTATFTTTITVLNPADSLIPMTRIAETTTTMIAAGTLNTPATVLPSGSATRDPGGPDNAAGKWIPMSCRMLTKFPDHPTAIVAAPSAYSSTRSQPMIHANSSPSVA